MRLALAAPLALILLLSAPIATEVAAGLVDGVSPTLATALGGAFAAEAAIIRKGSIKKQSTGTVRTTFFVVPEGNNEGVATVEVTFLPEPGAPSPDAPSYTLTSASPQGVGMFQTDEATFADDPEGFGYTMLATMRDANGDQVDDAFATGAFAQDVVPLQVASITLRPQDDGTGAFSVMLVGDSLADVSWVEITIYGGDENPIECAEGTTCTLTASTGQTAIAWDDSVTFDDPSSAVGVTYDIELAVVGSDNSLLLSGDYAVTVE